MRTETLLDLIEKWESEKTDVGEKSPETPDEHEARGFKRGRKSGHVDCALELRELIALLTINP